MFIIYSSPIKFTTDYSKACKIADQYFEQTGNIVAVEQVAQNSAVHVQSVGV
mgnify:CR=1 FL=1|tara:strand:- start:525 stop:680 length:156 start_codon:yes stop_codon:yes gene_type:complete